MTSLPRYVRQNVDLLVLLPILVFLIAEARTYSGTSGTYLLLFLLPAVAFTGLELLISALPGEYTARVRSLVSGHASDVELDLDETDTTITGAITDPRTRLVVFVALLFGFFAVAYLVGFLYGIPLFVVSVVYLLGTQNLPVALVVSAILMLVVYGLFGQLMNVPIL